MGFDYLIDEENKKRNWLDITRDERFFCAELYFEIKKDVRSFVKWLNDQKKLKIPKKVLNSEWEVGYEVCFYRDYIKKIGFEGKHAIGDIKIKVPFTKLNSKQETKYRFPRKRTFDLCLFSDKYLIIIEAKVSEGFDTAQLNEFLADKALLKHLLKGQCPEIILLGLCTSKYLESKRRQLPLEKVFFSMFNWKQLEGFANYKFSYIHVDKVD